MADDDRAEFEAAFQEFAGKKATAAAPPPAAPAPTPAPAEAPSPSPSESAAEAPSPGKSAEPSAQAAPSTAAPSADKAAAPGEPAQTVQPPDPETLQRQLDDLRQRERSASGRIGAFQREVNQLHRTIVELTRERDALKAAAKPAASQPPPAPPDDGDDDDDELANAPDLRKAVQRRIDKAVTRALAPVTQQLDAAHARLAEVDSTARQAAEQLAPLSQNVQEQQWNEARVALQRQFGDWRQTINTDAFSGWLEAQPPAIQQMYPGRDYHEAATVLTLYHAQTGAPLPKAQPAQAPGPTPASSAADAQRFVAATNAERLRQAAGIGPRGRPAPATTADPEDFHGAFQEFAAAAKQRSSPSLR